MLCLKLGETARITSHHSAISRDQGVAVSKLMCAKRLETVSTIPQSVGLPTGREVVVWCCGVCKVFRDHQYHLSSFFSLLSQTGGLCCVC